MGKKESWFSVIKRVFSPSSKDKLSDESEKKNPKEKKKKGVGKLKHGDSFIPLFRKPSSIEKILEEADQQEYHPIEFRPLSIFQEPTTPSFVPSRVATPLQDPWTPTPIMLSSPPRVSSPRRVDSPPRVSSSRRADSPPRVIIPERVGTPTKGSTSQRVVSSLKSATPHKSIAINPEQTVSPPSSSAPREAVSSSKAARPATPPTSSSSRFVHRPRPEPTLRSQNVCATRIQAAYRGYKARKSYRSSRGLVRLQTVMKGQSAKRQTVNAMKSMQLMVRVQTQIQSRRIQMLENRALQLQALESQNLNQGSENGNPDGWDDSRLTKDEVDARTQKKSEAVIKRERAMAYAYSHQSCKVTPKTPQSALLNIRASGGFPWWWSWLDRQANPTKQSQTPSIKNFRSTPPRPTSSSPLIPDSSNSLSFDNNSVTATPRSARSSAIPTSRNTRLSMTPPSRGFHNKFNSSPFKDDDSLVSCPPFSGPRYMVPTASTSAKVKGGFGLSPDVESKRRVSFPQGVVGSFKWNRRGAMSSAGTTPVRDGGSGKPLERKASMMSIGNVSVDSTVSMPAGLGRKPFNRFV